MALKQVIVVRSDLELGKGKIAAQSSHASLSSYKLVEKKDKNKAMQWEEEGQKKIVVKVGSEEELLALYEKMKRIIPCALIRDAGHTQTAPGTITCFGAGPEEESLLNKFTGHLKLL